MDNSVWLQAVGVLAVTFLLGIMTGVVIGAKMESCKGGGIMADTTIYHFDSHYCFYTCLKCGLLWSFDNDYGLQENQMNYCPKCGRRIVGVEGGGSK